jgi:hypothetical protein
MALAINKTIEKDIVYRLIDLCIGLQPFSSSQIFTGEELWKIHRQNHSFL